ncbi:GNAT family N-acetyltransferase [Paenibacillus daejeonensis]|uniref:GNAT family N-acetyltransferase n=1 Tax=Paenibacillus daejeonensis TaxID=135193 RepID=UPI00036F9CD4|nr:GNAT family protein [Paenibacillus daejeonensis]
MPYLYGARIMLREYRLQDVPYMRAWVNNPVIAHCLSDVFLYPHSLQETEMFVQRVMDSEGGHRGFIIAHRDSEEYIGQIDLFEIDWKNRMAEMGIVIGNPADHGRGYGREAIGILQQFVFHELNLHRLQLEVHEDNAAALACYRHCGFREEGRLRDRHYRKGRYTDLVLMSLLRHEYEQLLP